MNVQTISKQRSFSTDERNGRQSQSTNEQKSSQVTLFAQPDQVVIEILDHKNEPSESKFFSEYPRRLSNGDNGTVTPQARGTLKLGAKLEAKLEKVNLEKLKFKAEFKAWFKAFSQPSPKEHKPSLELPSQGTKGDRAEEIYNLANADDDREAPLLINPFPIHEWLANPPANPRNLAQVQPTCTQELRDFFAHESVRTCLQILGIVGIFVTLSYISALESQQNNG